MNAAVAQPGRAPVDTRAGSLSNINSCIHKSNIVNTEEFAEFYGIMIGDGTPYHKDNCKYFFTIAQGNREYASYIAKLVEKLTGKKSRQKYRSKAYRVEFKSKQLYKTFTRLGFPVGKKSSIILIPQELLRSNHINMVIRGIFVTGGSIFYTRKPGIEEYPTIEIASKSIILLEQLRNYSNTKI